jgi:hypothetical protein
MTDAAYSWSAYARIERAKEVLLNLIRDNEDQPGISERYSALADELAPTSSDAFAEDIAYAEGFSAINAVRDRQDAMRKEVV